MGSNFAYVSIAKAAKHLGVAERTVYSYIKKGWLRTQKQGKGSVVSRDDVIELKKTRERNDLPYPINQTTIARIEGRLQTLEQQNKLILRVLDIRLEPLRLGPTELENMYVMAQHHLAQGWSPHDEKLWIDVFLRITLEDFEEMVKIVTDNDHPWRPFYQLCKAMLQAPHEYEGKLNLNAGKANLEKIAQVWSTTRGLIDKELVKLMDKDDVAVRKAVRKRKPKED